MKFPIPVAPAHQSWPQRIRRAVAAHGINVLMLCTLVGVIALGAWLDRDLIARDIAEANGDTLVAEARAWEAQRQAEEAAHIQQVKDAYAQGLREGAAGAMQAADGRRSLQVAQACRALALVDGGLQ